MKKIIAWLLAIALTAAVSIGATLAYLTDTDEDVNVMTLGKVKIDQLEFERIDVESKNDDATVQEFHDNKPLIPTVTKDGLDYDKPGDTYVDWAQIGKDGYTSPIWNPELINNEVDKMVFVKNKGDYDAYVRSVFAFEAGKYTTLDQFKQMVHLNLNETDYTWEWLPTPVTIGESTYFVATATYNKVLAPGALTEISLSQIALDSSATNEDVEAFGDTYQVLVKSQGIQADGFDNAADALDEGFGVITTTNVPWDNDAPTKGIDVRTALHYLDGDNTTTAITAKVSSVTFGLNKDYTDIVDANTGVLVDVEQDVPVYAYYVKNGSNYDVYLLANDTIYAPTDCSNLCNGMSNLVSFNTSNLDFSRTTSMYQMFRDCTNLADVTSGNWNTANVTNMGYAFYNCQNLQTLVTANWNTGNVTNLGWTFFQCKNLKTIDTTNWDTSSVTSLLATFNNCEKLETLDVSNWDTSSNTDLGATFQNCQALKTLDVSNWDVSKVTRTTQMFNGCSGLVSLPVTNWKFENMQKTNIMFNGCTSLQTLDVSKWNMSTVVSIENMFNHCEAIEFLDVSNWNVSNVTNMGTAFQQCGQLKTLDVSNWDTSSVTAMGWLFYGCKNLEVIDISKWDVSKVTIMSHMFADCNKVKELKVDNWDLSSLQSLDATFNDCDALTTINVSKWNTGNIREFSQSFEGCDNLAEIVGLENWNTSNGRVFDEMFNACNSLKVLNLSSFNTTNVTPGFKNVNGDRCKGFSSTFAGMNSVEKIILGPNFRFAGNGQVTEQYQPKFPNPAPINGQATMWYNEANNTYYTAAEIPEPADVVVTYVAAVPPATP